MKSKMNSSFPGRWPSGYFQPKNDKQTNIQTENIKMKHNRFALDRSVNYLLCVCVCGGGLKWILLAPNLTLWL